ncbi:MAG: DUF1800 domain-containing protein [Bryobacteraceae bacterium]|nr:DUF1800 domain-containing protein [Bryobacteraceae bacterium]
MQTRLALCTSLCAALALAGEVRKLKSGSGPGAWTGDLTPIAASDWTYERAAHLLERAGFGGSPQDIEKLVKMGPKAAVDYLVDYERIDNPLPPFTESGVFSPEMMPDIDRHYSDFTEGLRASYRLGSVYGAKPDAPGVTRRYQPVINMLYYRNFSTRNEWLRAAQWWGDRMLNTRRPLEEKMTLFWHGHFATEHEKVNDYRLMQQQLAMLRANATGNFKTLLNGIAKDPAMLIYLDNRRNVKGAPNENFAREIFELFSLGVGNYTEKDIKEATRAFTGWDNYGLKFIIHEDKHDNGVKSFLGKSGNFSGEDVIDIILEQKTCAEFMSRKLYRYFVREDLTPELNARLARMMRESGYEMKPFLKTLFLSRDFYSPASYGTQIKSPVQYVISTYKKLGLSEIPGTPYFATVMANLGQNLGNPPNVKGWDGGRAWINPSTLLIRGNVARHLLFPEEAGDQYPRNVIPERYANAKKEAEERDRLAAMSPAEREKAMNVNKNAASDEGMMTMAPLAKRIGSAPDYDLKLGVYNGFVKTFETVKPTPPTKAAVEVAAMVRAGGVKTSTEAVDYFVARFLRLPLADTDYARVTGFARKQLGETIDFASPATEKKLREVLHLVLSMPEFQLS